MKKLYTLMMTLVLFALVICPMAVLAAATGTTDEVIASDSKAAMIYALVAMAIPVVASFVANFTEKRDSDSVWVRFAKNVVNLFALNFSAKAGK